MTPTHQPAGLRARLTDYLSLERNVSIASAAVFLLGLGEELWKKFLPKYLEALGASTPIIGLFGTAEDFFDAIYQYPGGWLADRLGRRRAFLIFVGLASAGYVDLLLRFLLAACFCRPGFRDGLAEHGLARDLRSHRRFPAARAPRDGIHLTVDSQARADSDRAHHWRCDDRFAGNR